MLRKDNQDNQDNIEFLPNEIIHYLFHLLDFKSFLNAMYVNKRWYDISQSSEFNSLFQESVFALFEKKLQINIPKDITDREKSINKKIHAVKSTFFSEKITREKIQKFSESINNNNLDVSLKKIFTQTMNDKSRVANFSQRVPYSNTISNELCYHAVIGIFISCILTLYLVISEVFSDSLENCDTVFSGSPLIFEMIDEDGEKHYSKQILPGDLVYERILNRCTYWPKLNFFEKLFDSLYSNRLAIIIPGSMFFMFSLLSAVLAIKFIYKYINNEKGILVEEKIDELLKLSLDNSSEPSYEESSTQDKLTNNKTDEQESHLILTRRK